MEGNETHGGLKDKHEAIMLDLQLKQREMATELGGFRDWQTTQNGSLGRLDRKSDQLLAGLSRLEGMVEGLTERMLAVPPPSDVKTETVAAAVNEVEKRRPRLFWGTLILLILVAGDIFFERGPVIVRKWLGISPTAAIVGK